MGIFIQKWGVIVVMIVFNRMLKNYFFIFKMLYIHYSKLV
jgi:hypothetical protein